MFLYFVVLTFGDSHFNKVVPGGRTNYCERFVNSIPSAMKSVSFQEPTHVASGSNIVTYSSRPEKKLEFRQSESRRLLQSPDPKMYYRSGDGVSTSMQVSASFVHNG